MSKRKCKAAGVVFFITFVIVTSSLPAFSEISLGDDKKLKLFGDIRFRSEMDWDSMQSNGAKRPNRDRLRIRFRMGLTYLYDEHILFGARFRTGNVLSQQSPHTTLGDDFEPKSLNMDKAFIHGQWERGWMWLGKNSFPFWTQNELFWDEDVNPEGFAAGASKDLSSGKKLKASFGYFVIDASANNSRFSDASSLLAGQLVLDTKLKTADVTAATGFYAFKENPTAADAALSDLNYRIWVLGMKASFKHNAKPLTLGLDFMKNAKNYTAGLFNGDQKTGYAASIHYGGLKEKKNWLFGYTYAHIEKYAVAAQFAQDDWLRWGSATDTRSSNFKGHEVRIGYAFGPSWNMLARLYSVKGIRPESLTATHLEDGNRFRVDFNLSF